MPQPLYPRVIRGPRTHLIGGWVGLRGSLDILKKKRKISPSKVSAVLLSISTNIRMWLNFSKNFNYEIPHKSICWKFGCSMQTDGYYKASNHYILCQCTYK
jgi:hypothetical protein